VRRRVTAGVSTVTAGVSTVVLAGVMSVTGIGVAYAYLVGTGTGAGTTGLGSPITLAPATITGDLYPGGLGTVALTATNPDPATVHINGLALDTSRGTAGFAVDTNHTDCSLDAFTFTAQTNSGAGWTVPAASSVTIRLTSSLTASTATSNACQGAALTVYLTATP